MCLPTKLILHMQAKELVSHLHKSICASAADGNILETGQRHSSSYFILFCYFRIPLFGILTREPALLFHRCPARCDSTIHRHQPPSPHTSVAVAAAVPTANLQCEVPTLRSPNRRIHHLDTTAFRLGCKRDEQQELSIRT